MRGWLKPGEDAINGQSRRLYSVFTLVRLIVREDHTSIFSSVYMRTATQMYKRGWKVQFILFAFLGQWLRAEPRRRSRELAHTIENEFSQPAIRLPLPPARCDWWWKATSVLKAYLVLSRISRKLGAHTVIEGNNAEATVAALEAFGRKRRNPIVYRCWGVDEEEYLYALTGKCDRQGVINSVRKIAEKLHSRQRRACEESDHIVCVSQAMADHLRVHFGCDASKISVIPCAVDIAQFAQARVDRDRLRVQLQLTNKRVLVYCGALQRYQMPHEGARLFAAILKAEPSAHFLVLTRETSQMAIIFKHMNVPRESFTILAVAHDEVPRYLGAADAGLLLRERCKVNEVASPVKFGEYMASGLPVVISEGIGDYSSLVQNQGVGVVLPTLEENAETVGRIANLLRSSPSHTNKCLNVARLLDANLLAEKLDGILKDLLCAWGKSEKFN